MVTGALAVLTMVVAEGSSLKHLGVGGYVRQFMPIHMESKSLIGKLGGLLLVGLIFTIEVISHLSRIVALTVRLAANMTAGHLLIFALIGMIFLFKSILVAPASVGFSAGVYLLEIFIALLQAFIFTLLTALFIGMAVTEHH
jgi:F-type H+-transporting ATPase subunit a